MVRETQTKTFRVQIEQGPNSGLVHSEKWYDSLENLSRPGDQPAVMEHVYGPGGSIHEEWHGGDGYGPHRDGDKPAIVITRRGTGVVVIERYKAVGRNHRDNDKPAFISRFEDGGLNEIEYYRFGKLHREVGLGPAKISYDEAGKVLSSEFWTNGRPATPKRDLTP